MPAFDRMDDAGKAVGFLVDNLCLKDLNPINCGWHQREPLRRFGPGIRDHYILHYVLSGKGVFTCGGRRYPLATAGLFLIRPGEMVSYEADGEEPWGYAWIGFEGAAAEPLLEKAGFAGEIRTAFLPEVKGCFQRIRESDPTRPFSPLRLCRYLYTIMAAMAEQSTALLAAGSTPALYAHRAAAYMQANYDRPITVEGMAAMLGIDRRYFSRLFTREAGMSPQAYLIAVRLQRAAGLLASRLCSVAEAAESVGYADAFTFSRMYKKRYGVSPSITLKTGRPPDALEKEPGQIADPRPSPYNGL